MSDNKMWIDFMAMSEQEQFEILDALVRANHQFQENEKLMVAKNEELKARVEELEGLTGTVSTKEE